MKGKWILAVALLGLVVVSGYFYFLRNRGQFSLLRIVSVGPLAQLLVLLAARTLLHGLQLKILTDAYDLRLGFSQWFGLSRVGTVANMLLPLAGGTSLKAFYLKKFHDLTYSAFVAATAVAGILRLLITAAWGMALMVILSADLLLMAVPGVVLIGSLLFLGFAHRLPARWVGRVSFLGRIGEEWRLFRARRATLLWLMFTDVLVLWSVTLELHLSFQAFSLQASFAACGVMTMFSVLMGMLKFLPSDLGVREAMLTALAGYLGMGVNAGLHAAVLHRLLSAGFALILASGLIYPMARDMGFRRPTGPEL